MTAVWEPVGKIEPDGERLKVTVAETVGFVDPVGVQILLNGGKARIFNKGVRIGRIRRSREGRGCVVKLDSEPRCSGSWLFLGDVIEGIRPYLLLSVFKGEPAPG